MKWIFISMLLILALLLAGCDTATPKSIRTFPLPGDPTIPYLESSLAGPGGATVALGKDGMKYFAWSSCDSEFGPTQCGINVTWTKAGERPDSLVMQQSERALDRYPDITVTDDGIVYLVWTRTTVFDSRYDCWAKFNPNSPGRVACSFLATVSLAQYGRPKIASYGNIVYAVYGNVGPGWQGIEHEQLRYRQLNPLDQSGGLVNNPDENSIYPAIAVSSAGTLHYAFIEYYGPSDAFISFYYGNNRSGKICPCLHLPNTPHYSPPAIGVAPLDDNRVYVAYDYNDTELITVTYPSDGSRGGVEGNPLPDWNWVNMGPPAMAVYDEPGNSTAFFAFSARSDSSPMDTEIYLRQWNADPVAQTDNDIDDTAAQIVLLKDDNFFLHFVLVLGWAEWATTGRQSHVYEETWPLSQAQVIATGADGYSDLELAGNGPYIGGIWGSYAGDKGIQNGAFNVHQISLPIILR